MRVAKQAILVTRGLKMNNCSSNFFRSLLFLVCLGKSRDFFLLAPARPDRCQLMQQHSSVIADRRDRRGLPSRKRSSPQQNIRPKKRRTPISPLPRSSLTFYSKSECVQWQEMEREMLIDAGARAIQKVQGQAGRQAKGGQTRSGRGTIDILFRAGH